MIKGVIFDIDGVLLDSTGIWKDLGRNYLLKRGIQPEERLSEILFSMSMEQGAAYLIQNYHLDKTQEELLQEIAQTIENFYFEEAELKQGARELLDYCRSRQLPMVAATSSIREHIRRAFIRNGIDGYMQEILTTGEVGKSKHDPLIFMLAADSLGEAAQNILVFEDSLYALETAKKAGFHVAGVSNPDGECNQTKLAFESEVYVQNLAEAIPFIERKQNDENSINNSRK